ncbi:hypothetical protein GOBAR_AA17435 [Gossypium barbadense]|uniref:Myb/SANT-like domain-containing protein n=2 Tax=Gossypium TaxID=3633 RepID=A0A2P5XIV8_GOSBA|nr:hypothetical protein GOBAR_AA17435 [Gossypium barbadense]
MSGTCIGIEMRASVRHVWDMHRPRDRHGHASQPCGEHGPAHGRVPWSCDIMSRLTSEIECPCFCTQARTRACHDRVRDTGHLHGRVSSRVKTPVDTRFKVNYLLKLERMIEKVLPHAMLKAKHNLESRIRILKKDWAIIYGMLSEKDNSGFGWDEHRQIIVVEDEVWESYISDVANQRNPKEGSIDNGWEVNASLDEMNVSATQSRPYNPNKVDSTFPKKKKRSFEANGPDLSTSLIDVATLLGDNIRTVDLELSRSIAFEMLSGEARGW